MNLRIFLLVLFMMSEIISMAQAPNSIPYQGVARDAAGTVLANRNISLRFKVHDTTAIGTVVYSESQSITTNSVGTFTANIGQGIVLSGTFDGINWGSAAKYIQVEMDINGSSAYLDMGTKQMLSVPYALYSGTGNAWKNSVGSVILENSNSFVGVGTSTPEYKLDVLGRMRLKPSILNDLYNTPGIWHDDYRTGIPVFFAGMQDSIRYGFFGGGSTGVGWGLNFNRKTGNVNIGNSTNESYRLALSGSDYSLAFYNTIGTYYGDVSTDASNNLIFSSRYKSLLNNSASSHILLNPPPSSSIFTNSSSNVGINTNSPSHAKIEVNGKVGSAVAMFGADSYGVTLGADNPEIGFNYFYNSGTKTIKSGYASCFGMNPLSGDLYIGNFNGTQSTSDFGSISGYQDRIIVKQNGNVGIGTNNPIYKLAVNGSIRTKEVIVETGWADYVFEKEYNLPSLTEVESFIKSQKHLPGIPSAQEIQENGLKVADTQTKMMQKIEELTLYIIDLQKQVEELKRNQIEKSNK